MEANNVKLSDFIESVMEIAHNNLASCCFGWGTFGSPPRYGAIRTVGGTIHDKPCKKSGRIEAELEK
jgi:hypothetical protein